MPTLTAAATLAVDPVFLARVTAAVQRIAVEQSNLIKAMPDITQADKIRWLLCRLVMTDPPTYGSRFAWAIASLAFPHGVDDQQHHAQHAGADAHPSHELVAGDHGEHQRDEPYQG